MDGEARPAAARPSYWLTRFAILRMLGLVYAVAFLVIVRQWQPLLGSDGLLPAASLLDAVAETGGSAFDRFFEAAHALLARKLRRRVPNRRPGSASSSLSSCSWASPTCPSCCRSGCSTCRSPTWGRSSSATAGTSCCSRRASWPSSSCPSGVSDRSPARRLRPRVVIVLLRWLVFRLMLGAGLIKLRGDPCWRDLTCLVFHYETQPNPNPLSWWFHQLPPLVPQARGALQPRRRARGPLLRVRAPAARGTSRAASWCSSRSCSS